MKAHIDFPQKNIWVYLCCCILDHVQKNLFFFIEPVLERSI